MRTSVARLARVTFYPATSPKGTVDNFVDGQKNAALALPKPEEQPVIRTVDFMCFLAGSNASKTGSDVL